MINYKAKSTDSTIFSFTRNDVALENLKYDNSFSFKAEINVIDYRKVEVQQKGLVNKKQG